MSNLSEVTPWSNNTNAPDIPNWLYLGEKAYFTGFVIDAMLYGTPTYSHSASTRPHQVYSICHSRDCYHPVLPMYQRILRPRKPRNGGYQVGTGRPHYHHVLNRNGVHRDDFPYPIHVLHREPTIPGFHQRHAWTC